MSRTRPVLGAALLGVAGVCVVLGAVKLAPGTTPVAGEPRAAPQPFHHSVEGDRGGPGGTASSPSTPPSPSPSSPSPPSPLTSPSGQAKAVGQRPGTVRLPEGGTATLVRREVASDGVLPVPDGVREATWWGAGLDAPKGVTLLAGHVNFKGVTGPFAELWRARAGQRVNVVDAGGKIYRYRVSEIHTVHKHDLPERAGQLFGQDGPHRLVLVTCGGRWIGGELGYDENRIVVATKE